MASEQMIIELQTLPRASRLQKAPSRPTSLSHSMTLPKPLQEDWSGTGVRFDVDYQSIPDAYRQQLKLPDHPPLGTGGYGAVYKIKYRSVDLARKVIWYRDNEQFQLLKKESSIGAKLDGHRHIIKLVGTFNKEYHHFNILTYPVAVCDLGVYLDVCKKRWDADELSSTQETAAARSFPNPTVAQKQHSTELSLESLPYTDRLVPLELSAAPLSQHNSSERKLNDRVRSLFAALSQDPRLGLPDPDDINRSAAAAQRLREIMGCITQAMVWMHSQGIHHQDLKPPNILLSPGKLFLTDFGLSRDRSQVERSSTEQTPGFSHGYAAPEILNGEIVNAKQADVYALGCVFLYILSVLHAVNTHYLGSSPSLAAGENVHWYRERQFRDFLRIYEGNKSASGPSIPRDLVDSVKPMFSVDRKKRPSMEEVDGRLKKLRFANLRYYGPCCLHVKRKLAIHRKGSEHEIPSTGKKRSKLKRAAKATATEVEIEDLEIRRARMRQSLLRYAAARRLGRTEMEAIDEA